MWKTAYKKGLRQRNGCGRPYFFDCKAWVYGKQNQATSMGITMATKDSTSTDAKTMQTILANFLFITAPSFAKQYAIS